MVFNFQLIHRQAANQLAKVLTISMANSHIEIEKLN